MKTNHKLRIIYLLACLLTVALGLASRRFGYALPDFVAGYAGDTLWAAMVYWGIGLLFPASRLRTRMAGALLFSYAIEVSQLYQADWINAIRATTLGALVLGHGFLWSDLICYTVGVCVAAGIDRVFFASSAKK